MTYKHLNIYLLKREYKKNKSSIEADLFGEAPETHCKNVTRIEKNGVELKLLSLPKRGISGCKFTKNIENDHKNKQKMIIKHGLLLKTAKQIVEQTVFRKKVKALLSDCFIHTMLHCTSLRERGSKKWSRKRLWRPLAGVI